MYKLLKGLEATDRPPAPTSVSQIGSAVFWSFFGVRKMHALKSDALALTPIQLIVGGVIGCIGCVIALLVLVRYLTS